MELTIDPYGMPRPMAVQLTSVVVTGGGGPGPMSTPFEAGEYVITASVHIRWQFAPASR
jgi:hypothetical protein